MAHPQIVRAHIEGKDFTLYYDYDQLRDGKLSRLTDDGKIEWFRLRMNFVFLEPLCRLYQGKTPAYRALNSTKQNDLPARSFVIPSFSVLLNGVEALGSFTTKRKSGNRDNLTPRGRVQQRSGLKSDQTHFFVTFELVLIASSKP